MIFFQDLKVGDIFNTKAACWQKVDFHKARVIQSSILNKGDIEKIPLNFTVVFISDKGEDICQNEDFVE